MELTKNNFLHLAKLRLVNTLSNFQLPPQKLLAQWFSNLLNIISIAQIKGKITHLAWINTPDGLSAIDWPRQDVKGSGLPDPLYLTDVIQLPVVRNRGKTYQGAISQTTFAQGIFPATVPEVEATILDLVLQTVKGKDESYTLKFTKRRDHKMHKESYELHTPKGREISLAQCTFIKKIFDCACKAVFLKRV